jgi:hypothetical protein
MEEILYKWIPSVGFPIAVAMYLLLRVEPKLATLSDCVKELVLIVKADTDNTKEMKNAIVNFTIGINDLKNEISKINSK